MAADAASLPTDIRCHIAKLALRGRLSDQFDGVVGRMAERAFRSSAVMINIDGRTYALSGLVFGPDHRARVEVCVRGTVKRRAVWKTFPAYYNSIDLVDAVCAMIARVPKRRAIKPSLVVVVHNHAPVNCWASRYTRTSRDALAKDVFRELCALRRGSY